MLPAIGTQDFRQLEFKKQLEIISLQLFQEEEYERAVGDPPTPLVELELDYPPEATTQPSVVDLPVSFVDHHWAAYSCAFKPQWYHCVEPGSCEPLENFAIDWRKMVNVTAFNFALLSLSKAMYYVFMWAGRNNSKATLAGLLASCRTLLWLDVVVRRSDFSEVFKNYVQWPTTSKKGKFQPNKLHVEAQQELSQLYDYDDINDYCPTIQKCDELLFWEFDDYVLHQVGRYKNGRWYFPLIPTKLYNANQFCVYSWDWLR